MLIRTDIPPNVFLDDLPNKAAMVGTKAEVAAIAEVGTKPLA